MEEYSGDEFEPKHRVREDFEFSSENGEMFVSTGYNPNGTITSTTPPEIVNNIQQIPVPSEIISQAVKIYYRTIAEKNSDNFSNHPTTKIKAVKGGRKNRLIFYCVYKAYLELDAAVDPCYVADIVSLNRNDIEQALKEYSQSGVTTIEPIKLIPFYVNRLNELCQEKGVEYNLQEILKGVRDIIENCRSTDIGEEGIKNISSKNVAVVSLYFFLNDIRQTNISQHIAIFEEACYLSNACIRRYHKQIERYYNGQQSQHQELTTYW